MVMTTNNSTNVKPRRARPFIPMVVLPLLGEIRFRAPDHSQMSTKLWIRYQLPRSACLSYTNSANSASMVCHRVQ